MTLATFISFYLAIAAYVFSGLLALFYVQGGDLRYLTAGKRTAALGNVFMLGVFALQWVHWGQIPFTGIADSLNLLLMLVTGIILTLQRDETMKPLLSFYLPALACVAIVTGVVGARFLGREPETNLNGLLLTAHVGLVFLAMAHFLVASLTSMAYIVQAQRLKHHTPSGALYRLPSLEQLDKTLFRLIAVGYPIFLVTIGFGLAWALTNPDLMPPRWFLAPKYAFTAAILVLFAATFYIRRAGLLRGPKLAYILFVGFTLMLATWILFEAMNGDTRGLSGTAI